MHLKILIKSGDENSLAEWKHLFQERLPSMAVHWWDDHSVAPEDVDFVLVWEPDPGKLATFPNLKIVFSSGAGADSIISDPAYPEHVPLVRLFTQGSAQQVSEYVALAALMSLKNMPLAIANSQKRHWNTYNASRTASDTTVGIMGLGNLGAEAATLLHNIGFTVTGWSRTEKNLKNITSFSGPDTLDKFLATADILVSLLPQTPETRHIISSKTLALLPQGACVVNAGRGSHVHIPDLIQALDSDQLSCAVLDVFESEPLTADSPLWTHPKVIVTPHIGANPPRWQRVEYVSSQIKRYLQQEPLLNVFDHQLGY